MARVPRGPGAGREMARYRRRRGRSRRRGQVAGAAVPRAQGRPCHVDAVLLLEERIARAAATRRAPRSASARRRRPPPAAASCRGCAIAERIEGRAERRAGAPSVAAGIAARAAEALRHPREGLAVTGRPSVGAPRPTAQVPAARRPPDTSRGSARGADLDADRERLERSPGAAATPSHHAHTHVRAGRAGRGRTIAEERVDAEVARVEDRAVPARGDAEDAHVQRAVAAARARARHRRRAHLPVEVDRARIDRDRDHLVDVVAIRQRRARRRLGGAGSVSVRSTTRSSPRRGRSGCRSALRAPTASGTRALGGAPRRWCRTLAVLPVRGPGSSAGVASRRAGPRALPRRACSANRSRRTRASA